MSKKAWADVDVVGDEPEDPLVGGHDPRQRFPPAITWSADEILAVEVEAVEQECRQRNFRSGAGDVEPPADSGGRLLKGQGTAVIAQRDGLAVEHDGAHRQGAHHLDQLWQSLGHVVERPGEDRYG